jgi:hypothetical protein
VHPLTPYISAVLDVLEARLPLIRLIADDQARQERTAYPPKTEIGRIRAIKNADCGALVPLSSEIDRLGLFTAE